MFDIIHTERVVKVDFIIRKEIPYRREEFRRRRQVSLEGMAVSMVAPEDLLLSKLHWAKNSGSELQMRDARNLIVSVVHLDWPYIEKWASELAVSDLLAEARW